MRLIILYIHLQDSEGQKQSTKRFKYTLLKTLFNFIKNNADPSFVNPCDTAVLKKTFRLAKGRQWLILEKDAVDEIIFGTENPRDRLMLELMARAGRKIGVEISPHDLRRHAATYASRAGAPIEIVSKVILRHANLSTTQRYLGKVSDDEASRWIDNIFR